MAASKGFLTSCCLYMTIRGTAGMFSQCYTLYAMNLLILFQCSFPFFPLSHTPTPTPVLWFFSCCCCFCLVGWFGGILWFVLYFSSPPPPSLSPPPPPIPTPFFMVVAGELFVCLVSLLVYFDSQARNSCVQ